MSRVLTQTAVAATIVAALSGCGGDTLTLGRAVPDEPTFGMPINLSRQFGTDSDNEDNPSLTADLLQIFFTSNLEDDDDTGVDVFTARRSSIDTDFGEARRLSAVSTDGFDTSPSISLDGLTLWVGSEVASDDDDDDEDVDIVRFTRPSAAADAWDDGTPETALNSSAKDIPRPLALDETVMPLGSQRDDDGVYLTYLAQRSGPGQPFGTPTLISELVQSDRSTVDAFLSNDGRLLFFNWEPDDGEGELYMAWRKSVTEPFNTPLPLTEINTSGDERDPWLSPDGTLFFFTSDRDSAEDDDRQLDIFQVPIQLPQFD
jgi:WD40 repeat protein